MLSTADEARVEALVAQLTLDEKVAMASGIDAWHTFGVPRLGIPSIKVTDGPNGARGGGISGATSACFPVGTALGATWSPELLRRVGAAIGQEARTKAARVLLGPTVNIHRHPLAGRNFECYSEDPLLSAELAVAFVEGIQGEGVAATMKHFVCNDSEFERQSISSEVGERALHEIYLAPFEAAIRRAGAWAAMTAYNRINGKYACDQDDLVGTLLKGEWGFDGLVMSDWWGTKSTVAAANAGLDLEMPGPPLYFGAKLNEAVERGDVADATIDDKARRLLRLALRTGAFAADPDAPEAAVDRPEHRALIREAAADGMVLLTNRDRTLPLTLGSLRSIAVIGPNADNLTIMGGGSSRVEPHHVVQPLEALRAQAGPGTHVRYEQGCRIDRVTPPLERGLEEGARIEFFDNADFAGEPALVRTVRQLSHRWMAGATPPEITGRYSFRAKATFRAEHSGTHRFTLTSAGLSRLFLDGNLLVDDWTGWKRGSSYYGRGSDEVGADVDLKAGEPHEVIVEFQSPVSGAMSGVAVGCREPEPADLLERAVALAAESDVAIVVVGLNADWEREGGDRVSLALPGRQDELVERVAGVNERTIVVVNAGSPVAMPWADRVAAVLYAWYPGQEGGDAIADVIFGARDPAGRLPTTFPVRVEDNPADLTYPGESGTVSYGEGVFVGYRGFRRRGTVPAFPFGHGLSYAEFDFGPPRLDRATIGGDDSVAVTVPVTNTSACRGSAVVQVYVHDLASTLLRPDRELKGFAKVALEPGESRDVRILLPPGAFAAWDPCVHDWVAEPGEFAILVGASVEDIRGEVRVMLEGGDGPAEDRAQAAAAILA
jgi:beta-glucosidase